MRKSYIALSVFALIVSLFPLSFSFPDYSYALTTLAKPVSVTPVRVVAPSIHLDSPIVPVGTNAKGEMAVPSGKTNNVGWYKNGTVPGSIGSSVLDAHVFAAFSALKKLKPGGDIYVHMSDGSVAHFIAADSKTYALANVPRDLLFSRKDGARLNLITCAGKLIQNGATYDHRLIVYAVLAK